MALGEEEFERWPSVPGKVAGDFVCLDDDDHALSFRWDWSLSQPKRNPNGTSGWAHVRRSRNPAVAEGSLQRVHTCSWRPCRARRETSKYGWTPVPMHVRWVSDPAEGEALFEPTAAVAASDAAVLMRLGDGRSVQSIRATATAAAEEPIVAEPAAVAAGDISSQPQGRQDEAEAPIVACPGAPSAVGDSATAATEEPIVAEPASVAAGDTSSQPQGIQDDAEAPIVACPGAPSAVGDSATAAADAAVPGPLADEGQDANQDLGPEAATQHAQPGLPEPAAEPRLGNILTVPAAPPSTALVLPAPPSAAVAADAPTARGKAEVLARMLRVARQIRRPRAYVGYSFFVLLGLSRKSRPWAWEGSNRVDLINTFAGFALEQCSGACSVDAVCCCVQPRDSGHAVFVPVSERAPLSQCGHYIAGVACIPDVSVEGDDINNY